MPNAGMVLKGGKMTEDYKTGDFCRVTRCQHNGDREYGFKGVCEVACPRSAHQFHGYLIENGYRIVKEAETDDRD